MATSSAERAALEAGDMDDLIPPSESRGASPSSSPTDVCSAVGYRICSFFSYIYAYIVYSYVNYRTEFMLGVVLVICSLLGLSGVLNNKQAKGYHNPSIRNDWSQIQSALDLKLGSIDHWCLRGGDEQCRCEDPLLPSPRSETKMWGAAHAANKRTISALVAKRQAEASAESYTAEANQDDGTDWLEDNYEDDWNYYADEYWNQDSYYSGGDSNLDIVFLGDSIVEQRAGKFFGKDMEKFHQSKKVFDKNWSKDSGAPFDGLALGIAGDTAPNVLWRITHGEMPESLNPRIWWVNVGTNDLGATQCSEEVTLLGILRVVEEIVNRKPDAQVVINSILPMTRDKSGFLDDGKKKRRGNPNFWPSIKAVNKQLERFADKHKSVKFFDATPIFTEKRGGRLFVDTTLVEDGVHPTAAGYKAWDKEIVKRIETIEKKDDEKKAADKAEADAAAAAAAAAASDAAATGDGETTDDEYSGAWEDDMYWDDMYAAAQFGDDDWLYAGQEGGGR